MQKDGRPKKVLISKVTTILTSAKLIVMYTVNIGVVVTVHIINTVSTVKMVGTAVATAKIQSTADIMKMYFLAAQVIFSEQNIRDYV